MVISARKVKTMKISAYRTVGRRHAKSALGAIVIAGALWGGGAPAASAQPATDGHGAQANLALGGVATQSSTYSWQPGGTADKAIDGNTDGTFSLGSVTHTNQDENPWWQVDLGASKPIYSVEVYNRTDCCQDRLKGARLFISNTPFDTRLDPAEQERQPGVTTERLDDAGVNAIGQLNRTGRYVMVQVPGWRLFSLAEVRVLGTDQLPSRVQIATSWGSYLAPECLWGRRYLNIETPPQTCDSEYLDVVPNDDGTVRLQTPNGGFVRYLGAEPDHVWPYGDRHFWAEADGDAGDPQQNFVITTHPDGKVSIRNSDGTYWRVSPDTAVLEAVPESTWLSEPEWETWSLFTISAYRA